MSKTKTINHSSSPLKAIKQEYHHKLTPQQQAKLEKMFNQQEMHDYFIKMQTDKNTSLRSIQLAGMLYSDESISKIASDIKKGRTHIEQNQQNIDHIVHTITEEEKKAMQLRIKRDQIIQQLEFLDAQTSGHGLQSIKRTVPLNPQALNGDFKPNILSKEQHEAYIEKMIKQRDQLDKRHQKNIQKLEKSRQKEEKLIKQMKEKKINKMKEKRRKQITISLEKKKQQHEKFLLQEKETRKLYEAAKSKKFLHEKIQQRFQNQVVIPSLEQKKKKLKQLRQFNKGFSINQIMKHQKEYTEKRNQSFSMIKSKVNQDWNYKPPEKTQKLSRFLEEEKTQQRKKLEQKKRKIDQKISRQENFINQLKERFSPKIDQSLVRQIQLRFEKQRNKRRISQVDSKVLGISYLQEAKKRAKKIGQRSQTQKQHSTLQSDDQKTSKSRRNYTNYLMTIPHDKQYYQEKRRKRLDHIINSEEEESRKIKKLLIQSQKISQQIRRKQELQKVKKEVSSQKNDDQTVQLLLSGIQAKMGIIKTFKGKNHQ